MNAAGLLEKRISENAIVGSYDHSPPAEQMRAVDLTMQLYFDSGDWLRVRNDGSPRLWSNGR